MSLPTTKSPYAGYRFPTEVISHAVWLYFRFPLALRMVEELLAARGIIVSHETIRQWALKFGQTFANQIRRRLPRAGDKWHLDEVAFQLPSTELHRHKPFTHGPRSAASPLLCDDPCTQCRVSRSLRA